MRRQGVSQMALVVKNPLANAGDIKRWELDPWVGKIPWRRAQQPTSVFLPGKFHGKRSLAGYSPRCCKELDMTEATWPAYTHMRRQRPSEQVPFLQYYLLINLEMSSNLFSCHIYIYIYIYMYNKFKSRPVKMLNGWFRTKQVRQIWSKHSICSLRTETFMKLCFLVKLILLSTTFLQNKKRSFMTKPNGIKYDLNKEKYKV